MSVGVLIPYWCMATLLLQAHFATTLINRNAGPIWEDRIANKLCPTVCRKAGLYWTGHWNTVKESELSVCRCNSYQLKLHGNHTIIATQSKDRPDADFDTHGLLPASVYHVILNVASPDIINACMTKNDESSTCNTAASLHDHALQDVRKFGSFMDVWSKDSIIGDGKFGEALSTSNSSTFRVQLSEAFLLNAVGDGKMSEFQLLYYNIWCLRNATVVASINIPKGFHVGHSLVRAAFVESYKSETVTSILPEPGAVFGPGPDQVPVPVNYADEDFSRTINGSWFICRIVGSRHQPTPKFVALHNLI